MLPVFVDESTRKKGFMFSWTITFFVIAIIAAVFGFGGIAASAAGAGRITFIVAIILAVASFLMGRGRNNNS